MEKKSLNIVIVGHIDHGKSTLIGRLIFDTRSFSDDKMREIKAVSRELGKEFEFAYLLDQLEEERREERTIDTVQAYFNTKKRKYVIIDVPGHVEFLKNMVTGASQADVGVLVVDVEAGLDEQTKRHAYILSLLRVRWIIIVINKMDLADYNEERFHEVKETLLRFLEKIKIEHLYVIPISAKIGDNISRNSQNMSWYKGPTLFQAFDSIEVETKMRDRPLRFCVQDIYQRDGKSIIVGRVESGIIESKEKITLLPSGEQTEIKSIEVFNTKKKTAAEGECVGLTLMAPLSVKRGDVICGMDDKPMVADGFKADIFWMAKEPLRINEPLNLRCATQDCTCIVENIESRINSSTLEVLEKNTSELLANEAGVLSVKVNGPIVVEEFNRIKELGRFVLDIDNVICGAGIITELL